MRATVTCPSGSSTSVKNTSHATWPWMLTGCTFFRIPSRVPLSTLAPAQYPFERKEKRPRLFQLRNEPRAVLIDEAGEQIRRQPLFVLRQQRPAHPVDHRLTSRQHMRIDDQARLWVAESNRKQ